MSSLASLAGVSAFAGTGNLARASDPIQTIPKSFAIPIVVSSTLTSQGLVGDRWRCSVSGEIAQQIGPGTQIRVCRGSGEFAVFTVTQVRPDDGPDQIRLSKVARERLGISTSGFSACLRPALATTPLTDSQAKSAEEFVERVADDGCHQGLVVLAPHGGAIEIGTSQQAQRVAATLAGAKVSLWSCSGYKTGGGAFDRWHVTSTLIDPCSFPGLQQLSQRGFGYAVAFHGKSAPGVLIGGGGPLELKQALRQAISAALGADAGPVTLAEVGQSLGGSSAANLCNWLTAGGTGGIQIEQSYAVRSNYWRDVADAVAGVYAGLV